MEPELTALSVAIANIQPLITVCHGLLAKEGVITQRTLNELRNANERSRPILIERTAKLFLDRFTLPPSVAQFLTIDGYSYPDVTVCIDLITEYAEDCTGELEIPDDQWFSIWYTYVDLKIIADAIDAARRLGPRAT